MVTITEFSPTIYFIRAEIELTMEELKQVPEVVKLVDGRTFQLKLDSHGLWILKFS